MPKDSKLAREVFLAAAELPAAQRAAFLIARCGDDTELQAAVERMLAAEEKPVEPARVLHRPATGGVEHTVVYMPGEQSGAVIAGRYKLLESIGEGGMGTVWVAEQTRPVRRKVAVKLIKPGMDSKSVLARFEAERQALAMMDHPNIAKVLDGGLTESGRPFFVMEYVKGVPITEYCEAARLKIPERLELFVQVCQAVQHAHQKGIIHRDLKPSNILVAPYDDRPVPKVIDFGLAKAMHQSLTDLTLYTAHETVLGTPLYMSPEQAQLNNLDVDTRSDLYSLGVLFYELLTGTTPLEKKRLKEAAWDEVRRIIREEEPPRPSTRLSSSEMLPSLAAGRQTEPGQLAKLVRGDLDWIAMKALEKDRTRRYETANGFALDVQRYLAGEPVLAAPPSAHYRLRKFARRHRAALTMAAAFALLLLASAAISVWQAVRATRALREVVATQHERTLAQVNTLRSAEISQVPYLIEGLRPFHDEIVPQLRQSLEQPDLSEKERLRLSLAMVADDEHQVAYLRDRLLTAEPAELPVIRAALLPHRNELAPGLWQIAEDPAAEKNRRFRALCALAAFDPESPRWKNAGKPAAEALAAENPLVAVTCMEALRPVRQSLLSSLEEIFRDRNRSDSERSLSADILADYEDDRPDVLADLLADADGKHFTVFMTALRGHGEKAASSLTACLAEKPIDERPDSQERFASRQANLAIALLLLGRPDATWTRLRHSLDPSERSWIIHRLAPLGADPQVIASRLEEEKDVSAQRALILSLGEFARDRFPTADREAILTKLLGIYRESPDAGLHGAAEWLLRQWKQQATIREIDQQLAAINDEQRIPRPLKPDPGSAAAGPRQAEAGTAKQWYINGQGQSMVILSGSAEFMMGAPGNEKDRQPDEILHRESITRCFAISSKEVTVKQFKQFMPNFAFDQIQRSPEPDCPILGIRWYEAAAYCNWLSKQEGIKEDQWCYLPNASGEYVEGMKLAAGWPKRIGYRLPSEAEWEYACRAKTVTSRYYGRTDELLDKYVWFSASTKTERTFPVASLKPNDFGLFDMLGNEAEWCQEIYTPNAAAAKAVGDDKAPEETVMDRNSRVSRGGAFANLPSIVRSAFRTYGQPAYPYSFNGFRVARTYK